VDFIHGYCIIIFIEIQPFFINKDPSTAVGMTMDVVGMTECEIFPKMSFRA